MRTKSNKLKTMQNHFSINTFFYLNDGRNILLFVLFQFDPINPDPIKRRPL